MTKLHFLSALFLGPKYVHASPAREIFAWASSSQVDGSIEQINNETWADIFDGIQLFCGFEFSPEGKFTVNRTVYDTCIPLIDAVHAKGGTVSACVGEVPQVLIDDPSISFPSASALLNDFDIDGISLDDEKDCAPRGTQVEFEGWINYVNELSDYMHLNHNGARVDAAVQAMFGIQDDPANDPCAEAPYKYPRNQDVIDLMNNSTIDRWLEMDTYYFSTNRYMDAIDWYTKEIDSDKLAVAVMNRDTPSDYITDEGIIARWHALEQSGATNLNFFLLPVSDQWLTMARRWKTQCANCPNGGSLSCYEVELDC